MSYESNIVVVNKHGKVYNAGGDNEYIQGITEWSGIRQVASASRFTVGLRKDGKCICNYNYNNSFRCHEWSDIKFIAVGSSNIIGIKEDNSCVDTVYTDIENNDKWKNIKYVDAGNGYSVGVREDGTCVATGYDTGGNTGVGKWTNIKKVACSYAHTIGLKEDGTCVACGFGIGGRMDVGRWEGVTHITCGYVNSYGLKEDGTVYSAGDDYYGSTKGISTWKDIIAIKAGFAFCTGLKNDGTCVITTSSDKSSIVESWKDIKIIAGMLDNIYSKFLLRKNNKFYNTDNYDQEKGIYLPCTTLLNPSNMLQYGMKSLSKLLEEQTYGNEIFIPLEKFAKFKIDLYNYEVNE